MIIKLANDLEKEANFFSNNWNRFKQVGQNKNTYRQLKTRETLQQVDRKLNIEDYQHLRAARAASKNTPNYDPSEFKKQQQSLIQFTKENNSNLKNTQLEMKKVKRDVRIGQGLRIGAGVGGAAGLGGTAVGVHKAMNNPNVQQKVIIPATEKTEDAKNKMKQSLFSAGVGGAINLASIVGGAAIAHNLFD